MKRFTLSLALVLAAAIIAQADRIFMKDGRTFEGKVIEETDDVIKLKMSKGTIPLKRAEIDRIEKGVSVAEEVDAMLEALTPSNPTGYVEAAEMCISKGTGDGPTIERLGNIATSLDPSLCSRAQTAIGDWYSQKGNRARAAVAYLAAYTADWKNQAVRDKFLKHRDSLAEQKKSQMKRLGESIQLAIDDRLAEAIPGLQASLNAPGACLVSTYVPTYRNFAALVADIRARVPCKTCAGKLWIKCYSCNGEGSFKCAACAGKGYKELKKNGVVVEKKDCAPCSGTGSIRCAKCRERSGEIRCTACKGVVPRAAGTWDRRGLISFKAAIDERMVGSLSAEEQTGPKLARLGTTTFDESFTEDGKLVFSGGKWVKPEEKR
ncbi:MAG: hypothetical protein K8T20_00870 [Planctomycetes bacterium]|nr:hypothetical protein [Planctomycetota bacterium]